MYILNICSPKQCVHSLVIYFYFTNLIKELPSQKSIVLDKCHVNTAFTYTCPGNAEIVLYRKEEWMKVFIHETFHTFGLDFSNMSQESIPSFIHSHFNIHITPCLYESYTEFWGEIIHIMFLSYSFHSENKTLFIKTFYNMLNIEINHTLIQVNFNDFIEWCIDNNSNNIICFTKNNITLQNYLLFIKKYYKKKLFLEKVHKYYDTIQNIKDPFLQRNLRMTAIEYIL